MLPNILTYDPEKEYFFREGCFINELSNSDVDPDLSVARVRVRAGEQTRWHRLEERIERYVILQGDAMVEIGDLEPSRVSVGDVVLIPAGCRQRIRNTGGCDLVFLALCTPRFLEAGYREDEDLG
ncbi:MAG: cupin domain-containing protein [Candidatus Thiodiazotropha sp.]